jgi:GH15 family glucan-1,4-alpha-glucosidase
LERYPAIADHGLIGDLQTAALVTSGGVVDWFCCPRFDSPSIFASLLDPDRGGHSGEQLGNFPQAFTRLGLINAAVSLDYQLDHGPRPGGLNLRALGFAIR